MRSGKSISLFVAAIFFYGGSSVAAQEPSDSASSINAPQDPDIVQNTPAPTSPYGLRPTYRPSKSKTQQFNPELDEKELPSEDDVKSESEQELEEIYGQ